MFIRRLIALARILLQEALAKHNASLRLPKNAHDKAKQLSSQLADRAIPHQQPRHRPTQMTGRSFQQKRMPGRVG